MSSNSIFEEYKKEFLKSRKRSRKATYKLMNTDVQIKKNLYKSLTKAPKRFERLMMVVFIIFVFEYSKIKYSRINTYNSYFLII